MSTGQPKWIDPLTDRRWPQLLARHPNASLFQSRGWLEALRKTYGYEPVALTTTCANREFKSAMVFCVVASRLTGRRLVSTPFSDHCEPLVDDDDHESLIGELNRNAGAWRYIELRPRRCPEAWNGFTATDNYLLHRLDLSAGLQEVKTKFHKNHVLRKIRRSEREQLSYHEGRSDELLRSFYKLVIQTRRRHRLPPQPYEWFRAVLDCLPQEAKIRVAAKDGKPVAAVLTMSDSRTMTYKYGASNADAHCFGGMQMLLWRTVQEACDQGCTTMDFGRSRAESEGEVAFKDHWGAPRASLVYLRTEDPRPRRGVIDRFGIARLIFSALPDRLLVAAGSMLYRHVG